MDQNILTETSKQFLLKQTIHQESLLNKRRNGKVQKKCLLTSVYCLSCGETAAENYRNFTRVRTGKDLFPYLKLPLDISLTLHEVGSG